MFDSKEDWDWPAEPASSRDRRVIAAIIGAGHAVTRRIELSSRDHGLDAVEALVLVQLRVEPKCPPWQMRSRLGFHRSTLSSILDRLERDGLVKRSRNSVDGRRFEIDLTPAGRVSADIAASIIADVEAELAGYTSPTERRGANAVFEASMALERTRRD